MNAAGTLSHATVEWRTINWRRVNRNVRRLQIRIAEAMKQGRRGKVHALRRILTRALGAACWAVRKVTESRGKNTPGIDGKTWSTPEEKQEAVGALQRGRYSPLPLRRLYIPKAGGKKRRPLGIPVLSDRARQTLHALALDPIAETLADPNSYGFRRERAPVDAIGQCFLVLARGNAAQWILEGDICACFDNICQKWLVANTPMDKGMLSKWLKAGYVERDTFQTTDAGTAQGTPISPMLCNLTLDGLEPMLKRRFPNHKVNVIRFADDFVVTGDSKALLEQEVKPAIAAFLAERGLSFSEEKTHIVHIGEGFDFLGQNVRKYNGKLIIKPAKKAVKKLLANVRGLIKTNPTAAPATLIEQLNPIIRGWAQYHRYACSKQTFSTVDSQIVRTLWRWAKRRHPNKPRRWIKQRYFTRQGGNQWVFAGRTKDIQVRYLFRAAALPIRRHIKVRMDANPYDLADEMYFENRRVEKWKSGHYGHTRAKQLWLAQQGRCPHCSNLITKETGWDIHHQIPLAEGGPDTMDNRVLLHPTCHRQLHARKKTTSPAPAKGL